MRYLTLVIAVILAGCIPARSPRAVAPAVSVGGDGLVKIDGDAKTPAKVETKKTDGVLAIPEGSSFVFNEKLGTMSLVISKATQMSLNRTETAIQGPVAFTPQAQPTAKEVAEAKSDFWTVLGLRVSVAIGGAAAIFGLVRDWNLVMFGGLSILGSGLFGLFIQSHPFLLVIVGLGVTLAFVGPWLWHTKLKKITNDAK